MSCSEIRELLPDALTGGAGPDENARVERHLVACGECRREVAEIRGVIDLVRDAAAAEDAPAAPPPDFDAVLARVRGSAVARPARSRAPVWLTRAAALLLAAFAGAVADRWLATTPPPPEATAARAPERTDSRERARAALASAPGGLASGLAVLDALRAEEPQ